jgi:hypothetical protein
MGNTVKPAAMANTGRRWIATYGFPLAALVFVVSAVWFFVLPKWREAEGRFLLEKEAQQISRTLFVQNNSGSPNANVPLPAGWSSLQEKKLYLQSRRLVACSRETLAGRRLFVAEDGHFFSADPGIPETFDLDPP